MRLVSALRIILLLLCSCLLALAADTSKFPKSITLSYELISSAPGSVKPLCTVFYDPKTLKHTLSSWTPPSLNDLKSTTSQPASTPFLRILLPNGSSTVTSLSTFSNELSQHIVLWLSSDPDGSIFSASVTSTTPPPLSPEEERYRQKVERAKARGKPIPPSPKPEKPKKLKIGEKPKPQKEFEEPGPKVKVSLGPVTAGPTPKLVSRAPPPVDTAGNEVPQQEEQEKNFFQKWWWVFLLAAAFSMMGTGGGDK